MARDKDEIIYTNEVDRQYMLEKRRKVQLERRIATSTWILRLLFVLFFIGYLLSGVAHVRIVTVEGNSIIDTDYIKKLSGISRDSFYYFFMPSYVEYKLERNPLITNAHIVRKGYGIVHMQIEEANVVASISSEGKLYYVLADASLLEVTNESLSYMSKVPYVDGIEVGSDLLAMLAKELDKLSDKTILMMSEIIYYPLSYDNTQLKILMIDQNTVFATIYSLSAINGYEHIISSLPSSGMCIYFDSLQAQPYAGECISNEPEMIPDDTSPDEFNDENSDEKE